MVLSVLTGCILTAIIAFILFLILFRDEFFWLLSKIPDFLKNFFMAISKAWRFAVQGIMINCKPIRPLKLKNKKDRNCYKKQYVDKIKKEKDDIDEDKSKLEALKYVKDNDNISEIYNKRKTVGKEHLTVYSISPKKNSPLDIVGYKNKTEAENICKKFKGKLATKEQIINAYDKQKIDWCNYGWFNTKNSEICLPLQSDTYDNLTDEQRSRGLCGSLNGAGVNCIKPIKNEIYSAICYGKKPTSELYEIK